MKKKTVWIIGAIIVLGALAVIFALARAWAYRPILIEGTIADEQGNAMHGVSVYVSFVRRRGEDHYFPIQELEETVDSSFHYEGRGDGVIVIFSKKGYAPMTLPATGRNDRGKLILSDLRIVMKELTPEEVEERLFGALHSWRSNDNIVRYKGEKYPTDEDQLERLRKNYGLEKSDMTDIFMKSIRDYLSELETKSEDSTLRGRYIYAMIYLPYYPPPQQMFLELIRRTFEVEPESDLKHILIDELVTAYKKTYPDAESPDAR
jgi:hypothetical protein